MSKPCREISESSSLREAIQELPNHKLTVESSRFDPLHVIGTWEEPVT